MTTLRDLMTESVVTTSGETSVAEAARAMSGAKVGSAVVMQGMWLAGILTERDVLRAAASGEDLNESPVSKWRTPDAQSPTPETSADDAARVMLLTGVRHPPGVARKQLAG